MQRLIFENSPAYIILCLIFGAGYAIILYKGKYLWSRQTNQILFALRFLSVALLTFLLIGPILKLTQNLVEKPSIVFLVDNSLSVKEAVDSIGREKNSQQINVTSESLRDAGYEVSTRDLSGIEKTIVYSHPTSDINGAIRSVINEYEGKNLTSIVLLSDGIYNSGTSPLYSPLRIPVTTIGLGDTTQRTDLVLKNLAYNKIAYQGNKFPLRAEVLVHGLPNKDVAVSIFQSGKLITKQSKNSGSKSLLDFDFQLDALDKGLQQVTVIIESVSQEANKKNNRASAFIEVVEGKKKILVIAPAPHPDLKALRSVVEKNSNYEFILHVPAIQEASQDLLDPGKVDLILFHTVMDKQGKTAALYSKMSKGPASLLIFVGTGTNLRLLQPNGIPLSFENLTQWDEVTPVINPAFRDFGFSDHVGNSFSRYPPASVPFGKFSFPATSSVLLYQRIGNVTTDRPMVFTYEENGRKTGVAVCDGIWRWRLNEFSDREKTESFDEVFSKFIQYLSTQEDKRKFRSFPIQNEFTDSEEVIFESQAYNDLYEQIFGHKIDLKITDENGKITSYNYITSPGGSRYRMGGMNEGVYKFEASTVLNNKKETISGQFLVTAQNMEAQNLTADFGMLRKLSVNTGGKFYKSDEFVQLTEDLKKIKAKSLVHSEQSFNPLINLKWIFLLLLLIISAEWFVRKYLGAY